MTASMPEFSIGVDLGGTNLRAAAIDRKGQMTDKVSVATDITKGRDKVMADLVAAVDKLRSGRDAGDLAGIGIGIPGFIDMQKGVIANSPNLPGFEDFPIRQELTRKLQTPIQLENDANAAALGEKWMGAGKDVDDLILLTLGTGIGGGIIYRGQVVHGFVGMAGEIGHITVVPGGNPCACGNNGCLEKYASATAIESMANLLQLGRIGAEEVYELAVRGNAHARRVFETMGSALGIALAALVNIFNFPLYLLTGGPLPAWGFFSPTMFAELERRSLTYRATKTRVEKAALGGQAGLYGAAYLPFLHREQ
jgi:glucokinase